jgi:hypothetical protein
MERIHGWKDWKGWPRMCYLDVVDEGRDHGWKGWARIA